MKKLKIYYPTHLFDENHRESWFELIKSKQRHERGGRTLDQRIQERIEWVDSEVGAELFILPLDWNFYYQRRMEQKALYFCNLANNLGKKVISFSGGDQGITVPVPANTIVYRQSGYRSKRKFNERTAPFFLSDPITVFLNKEENDILESTPIEKPIIGFCGMAPHGIVTELKECAQVIFRNLKSSLRIVHIDTQEVLSSSNLRYKTLELFKKSDDFQDNYIIRQKYRGGVQTPENRKKTTDEYYQNQIDSDLVICVRGIGNFSVRFYETLAMGRIPVFVDTDSPLPDISPKKWRDYIIWVDRSEINRAPEIVLEWLSQRNLRLQQQLNRQLWVEHFRLDNFWIRELEHLQMPLSKDNA